MAVGLSPAGQLKYQSATESARPLFLAGGVINGRKLVMIFEDDGHSPGNALAAVMTGTGKNRRRALRESILARHNAPASSIGSLSLNDVLSTSGTPVRAWKHDNSSWKRGLASRRTI
jgi:hypothetical protein